MGEEFVEKEESTGKALGIMGMVRKHQPQMTVNERFGWVGDVHGEEGSAASSGDIRTENQMEKCMSVQKGGWGYVPDASVLPFEQVAVFLSDCVVRNMNLLLNVAPDREGVIPQKQQEVLLKTGEWLKGFIRVFVGIELSGWTLLPFAEPWKRGAADKLTPRFVEMSVGAGTKPDRDGSKPDFCVSPLQLTGD